MKKRIMSVILAAVMVLSVAACSKGGSSAGKDGHMELTIACLDIENYVTHAETDVILKHVEEKFNITIKPVNITSSNFGDQLTLWATNNSLPDIMFGTATETKQFAELARDGIIRSIPKDMMEKYSNVQAYMKEEPGYKCLVDDEYYAIYRASYLGGAETARENQIVYRWDLAQAAGVTKEPETWEEFNDMLKKIQAANPGMTGLTTNSLSNMISRFLTYGVAEANSEGLATKWVKNVDGNIVPAYFTGENLGDDALPVFELARKMYNDGTIDPDIAVVTADEAISKFKNGKAAAIAVSNVGSLWGSTLKNWEKKEGVSIADSLRCLDTLPAHDGTTYTWVTSTAWSENYFSSNVDDAKMERILELYDWLLSDEGFITTYYGFEGETYEMTEDGVQYMADALTENPSINFWNQFIRWPEGFVRPEGFKSPELDMPSINEYLDNAVEEAKTMPRQSGYDMEQNAKAQVAYRDMDTKFSPTPFTDFIKIMTGKEDVATMWNSMLKEYEKAGMSEVIKHVTKACK